MTPSKHANQSPATVCHSNHVLRLAAVPSLQTYLSFSIHGSLAHHHSLRVLYRRSSQSLSVPPCVSAGGQQDAQREPSSHAVAGPARLMLKHSAFRSQACSRAFKHMFQTPQGEAGSGSRKSDRFRLRADCCGRARVIKPCCLSELSPTAARFPD